ncbi:MAG TPA: tetratricopeptide repeat protein [Blastocatellia bacterium]|nr:tetratricopeptide repeat protein [Blastocatellia bacterium]
MTSWLSANRRRRMRPACGANLSQHSLSFSWLTLASSCNIGKGPAAVLLCLLLSFCCQVSFFCQVTRAQSKAPEDPRVQAHLQRARSALAANASSTAVAEYQAILEIDPKNVEAQANLGVIAFFGGDCQGASRYFNGALAVQPALPKAEALLGICEKRTGLPGAAARLERSFSALTDSKLRVQAGTELAGLYYQRGDLHRAAGIIQSLIEIDPDNIDTLYFAQLLYSELADDTLGKLAVLAPGSARMQQVIGERLINAGDLKGAIEHYKLALGIDPRLGGVRFELSQAILETASSNQNAQAESQRLLEEAVKIEGDNPHIESLMGEIAVSRGDLDTAYKHYDRALALNPSEVQAEMGLARLSMEHRKPDEAVKFLLATIQADPLNGEAHYRLGLAYRGLGRASDSEKELRLFQEIKKTKDQLKDLYRQMNKQPRGDRFDEAALKLKPDG